MDHSARGPLSSEYGSHLNWPAFARVADTAGLVTRIGPGFKKIAIILSHMNAWPITAGGLLERRDEAAAFYDVFARYTQQENIEVRKAEPYLVRPVHLQE